MMTLRSAALAAFALAAFSHSALASDYGFAKDGMIAEIETAWPSDYIRAPEGTMFSQLSTVGGLDFALSTRPLSYFVGIYGGQVQHFAHAGYAHAWLCYRSGDTRQWLFTNGGSDNEPRGQADWLIIETADPDYDAAYGCSEQPLAMLVAGDKVPAIGKTRDEISRLYGTILPNDQTYVTLFEMSYEAPYTTSSVSLRFDGEVVTGVSLAQGSEE